MSSHQVNVEPLQQPFSPRQSPARRDTQSTTSSRSQPASIAPGFYSLSLNGHCPRCRHLHKAVAFNIRISGNLNHTTVKCERCGSPWLALGGNSTCWSLLSTQTIDLDPTETEFQSTLIKMVRSLAVVGSPALASVPESVSGGASREQPVRYKHGSEGQRDYAESLHGEKAAASEHMHLPAPDTKYSNSKECLRDSAKSKRALSLLTHLRAKIREQFAMIRNSDRFKQVRKKPGMTAKRRGKLPIPQPTIQDNYSTQAEPGSLHKDDVPNHKHVDLLEKEEEDARQKAVSEAAGRVKRNEEKLKAMTNEERANWIREQLSDFKCRCLGDCRCRRPSTRSDIDHQIRIAPSLPQLTAQHLAQRRISTDIAGIGADFEGVSSMYPPRMSLDSTTRLSQAATVVSVDSVATTSRPALPFLSVSTARQRQAPRSPRRQSLPIASFPASRLREQLRLDDIERRSSVGSMATGRAVRGFSGTIQHLTGDLTFLPLDSMLIRHESATQVEIDEALLQSLQDSENQHTSLASASQALSTYTLDERTLRDSVSNQSGSRT